MDRVNLTRNCNQIFYLNVITKERQFRCGKYKNFLVAHINYVKCLWSFLICVLRCIKIKFAV